MTDDDQDHDDERDPLLVRPYLLGDAGAPGAGESAQTWPSATTREVRSQRALEGADEPTALLPLTTARRPARPAGRRIARRRILVLVAACVAVLLGAAAAGFAALRSAGRPSVSAALPDAPVPALTGLVPPSPDASPAPASSSPDAPRKPASRRAATARTATTGAAPATRSSAAAPSTSASAGRTASPPAGLAPSAPRTGTIRGQNGLCLDLNGALTVDFNHVQVFDCNRTAAQSWTLGTDGSLRVLGMCALIVGDDSVRVTRCDGRTTARWRASGQLLINTAGDKCLTDPSSGTNAGIAVRVGSCTGRANQRWSLP
ncbi:ricin-type beta-trefoil lectin domain protein [Paractinoplanes rhizophilus]|uniref:Ricin-type beta-trefoil lectin domain protein n=1 Tax=Paractinoplanes rhizophilus TaxID=1416877 RepID=A0ABW2HHG0_9ACTN